MTSDAILFEFLRGSQVPEHLSKKNTYLQLLFGEDMTRLPIHEEIFETARKISNIYASRNINSVKQISLVDCIIAAQMKKYNENQEQLFLITCDNNDFPLLVFDRIDIYTIDAGKDIFNLGVYCFDNARYQSLVAQFE